MDAHITPEPPEDEREAIDEALAVLLSERVDPYGEWWRAGLRAELSLDDEPA
jgi:hypothetical protein